MELKELVVPSIVMVFGVIGWLLRQKDAQQEQKIKDNKEILEGQIVGLKASIEVLFKKHDIDANALQEFRISIAEGHYKKTELDFKFEKLEHAITNSFDKLGIKFDELTKALINHIDSEGKDK